MTASITAITKNQPLQDIAQSFGVPLIDLDSIDPGVIPISLVNEKLITRHGIIPLYAHGNYLFLATDDPSKQDALKEIQFHTGLHTHAIVVETDKLGKFIDKFLHEKENAGLAPYENTEDAPIVRFVNKIILTAIKKGASDIHFEPYERDYRIRYRVDGLLMEVASPPVALASRITSRLKVMSKLDISKRRIPQDGRFKMRLSKTGSVDFRVSTCPTLGGEKIVMRILDPSSIKLGIESLGFNPGQKQHVLNAIAKPQGMILVTGPTGSGKTVTQYAALNILNRKEVNISTVEDPVEIKLRGINQVTINPKTGLTFSSVLRAFLRQDPDIIMVGEIRDLETAEIAIKAAQTGHLVLSTLHTTNASETLTRLTTMGIPSFNIASSISLIIAQRLARRLCEQCKVICDDILPNGLIELGFNEQDAHGINVYKAVGCNHCSNGYKGRIGLFEVLPISKAIEHLIISGGNSFDILQQAHIDGFMTIYQSGLEKIKDGITTLEEINRVTFE